MDPIEDALGGTLEDAPEDWLADPEEMLAPGTRGLEELEVDTCEVDE